MIQEQEGKVEWKAWIKDDEVVVNIDSGHISCDLASTQIRSQDKLYLDLTWSTKAQNRGTQPEDEEMTVVIEEDQDTDHLGLL